MKLLKLALIYLVCGAVGLVCLVPLLWIAVSSFKKNSEFLASPWKFPQEWMFSNYIETWQNAQFSTYMLNSALYAISSVLLCILICAMASFAIVRLKIKWGSWLYQYFMLGIMIPMSSLIVPLYLLISNFQLLDTRLSIIVVYVTFTIPITTALLSAFMREIPAELEESALIDGSGLWRIFASIILPLCMPAIATASILNFLTFWNEFIFAMMFTSTDQLRTLPVALASFRGEHQTDYVSLSVGMIIAMIPTLIVFIVMQEKVVRGVTGGAVKG